MEEVFVNIGEIKVLAQEGRLVAIGLGSCVGLILYDELAKIGGMAHVFLPTNRKGGANQHPGKFADTAVSAMVEQMAAMGAQKRRLKAKMAGGSQLFSYGASVMDVGRQNVEALQRELQAAGIPLVASDVLGSRGRKLIFDVGTGQVLVFVIGQEPVEL
ncbi:MAG: chemotaxis protein CheD [Firmicutes bacterium]|nr:chemotaxis protein CheD [Bacillota bacterium]